MPFCSEPCPPVDGRKEKTNTSLCLRLAILGDISKINGIFFFLIFFLTAPQLYSIKEPDIHTPTRWLFSDISLPSSWSAGFLNKVIFLASTLCPLDSLASHVASRVSLDSVTEVPQKTKNRITIWSSNPTPGHITREKHNPKGYICSSINCSAIHNSEDMETTSMSTDRCMIKKMWCINTVEYYSAIKRTK